ncbi:MAG: A/G-specific adenine glycosylase [Alphaproteobacteria bacterium]|nr:A/G-specific adenine glycosylase [Alphaproteobacteria bacterium]
MALTRVTDNPANMDVNSFRKSVLDWYDKCGRVLPWRARVGEQSDPYHVWLSEIMLQQTTVVTVGSYFERFIQLWPSVYDLAKAEREEVMHEWAGLGYYARARNLHKCANVIANDLGGKFPHTREALENLPGIGPYTSAAISAIAFNRPANVVDGNIERIMARLFAIEEPLPASKKKLVELAAALSEDRTDRPGDYAQALMDLGAGVCTPKSPKCGICPVQKFCKAYTLGIQEDLPKKLKKKPKPQRRAIVYWVTNARDEVLLLRRGEDEMLGGMLGLPTTKWGVNVDSTAQEPLDGAKNLNLNIKHSFTHFDLTLDIYELPHKNGIFPPEKHHNWVLYSKIAEIGLPTLFKKVVKLMK